MGGPVKVIPWVSPYGGFRGRFVCAPVPAQGRAYYNTTINSHGLRTEVLAGYGSAVGAGTAYPLPPFPCLDQAFRYYWRAMECQIPNVNLSLYLARNPGDPPPTLFQSFTGTTPDNAFPRIGYSVSAGLRTFGYPALTDTSQTPTIFERASGLNGEIPGALGPKYCGIMSPADSSTITAMTTQNHFLSGPDVVTGTVTGPAGSTTTNILSLGPGGVPVYYVLPTFSVALMILPSVYPILYDPGTGYYLPCGIGSNGNLFVPSLTGSDLAPSSINPQEVATTTTDYRPGHTDFFGNPAVTTLEVWPTSAFTWALDGMTNLAAYDVGGRTTGVLGKPASYTTIPGVTYAGNYEFRTYDS
jgi:hypothetical protein